MNDFFPAINTFIAPLNGRMSRKDRKLGDTWIGIQYFEAHLCVKSKLYLMFLLVVICVF